MNEVKNELSNEQEDFLSEFKNIFIPESEPVITKQEQNTIRCGEIIWNYENFQVNCIQCNKANLQTFQTVAAFLNHMLKEHLKIEHYLFNEFLQFDEATSNEQIIERETEFNHLLVTSDEKNISLYAETDPIDETIEPNSFEKSYNKNLRGYKRAKRMKVEDNNVSIEDIGVAVESHVENEPKEIKRNKKRIRIKLQSKIEEVSGKPTTDNLKDFSNECNKKNQQAARPERMTCEICGKNIRKYAMRKHLKSHDDNRYAHKCPECNKLFVSLKNLELHRKNLHIIDGRQFLCTFDGCNKKCVSEKALKEHTKSHTSLEERPFKCDLCHRKFFYESKLHQHIRIIHVNGKTFKCDKCDRSYYLEYDLKRHKVVHEEIKPFACDQCSARFVSIHTLARHKKCHSSIKDYCCNICGKQFAIYDYMYAHMKTHGINYSKNYEKTISQSLKLPIENNNS